MGRLVKIGFTGTQQGMTDRQADGVLEVFTDYSPDFELHHGDCIGADAQAHTLALPHCSSVVIHPPKNPSKQAGMGTLARWPAFGGKSILVLPRKEYLDRNRDIVNQTTFLVATPHTFEEVIRSGTWYTIRFAKKIGRHVCIIYPDGKTEIHESKQVHTADARS